MQLRKALSHQLSLGDVYVMKKNQIIYFIFTKTVQNYFH